MPDLSETDGPQRYRRRAVVVEAMHWDGSKEGIARIARWANLDGNRPTLTYLTAADTESPFDVQVETRNGPVVVEPDEWIIRGIEGEFYPCAASVFDDIYDAASDETDGLAEADEEMQRDKKLHAEQVEVAARAIFTARGPWLGSEEIGWETVRDEERDEFRDEAEGVFRELGYHALRVASDADVRAALVREGPSDRDLLRAVDEDLRRASALLITVEPILTAHEYEPRDDGHVWNAWSRFGARAARRVEDARKLIRSRINREEASNGR